MDMTPEERLLFDEVLREARDADGIGRGVIPAESSLGSHHEPAGIVAAAQRLGLETEHQQDLRMMRRKHFIRITGDPTTVALFMIGHNRAMEEEAMIDE
jgi:hypothetical protein